MLNISTLTYSIIERTQNNKVCYLGKEPDRVPQKVEVVGSNKNPFWREPANSNFKIIQNLQIQILKQFKTC